MTEKDRLSLLGANLKGKRNIVRRDAITSLDNRNPMTVHACFRFYAELNAFLSPANRQRSVLRACPKGATLKHMIEACGVPHTEVELIIANGVSVGFGHPVRNGDRISIYPYFSTIDISPLLKLPFRPLRGNRFIADSHLGRLASRLRMLGFDVLYDNHYSDREIALISSTENRIVLSRDRNLLLYKQIERGCFVHAISPDEQVLELMKRLDLLLSIRPFTRCLRCNGLLHDIDVYNVGDRVPERNKQFYSRFLECDSCRRIYWEGSHMRRMRAQVDWIIAAASKGRGR